MERLRRDKEDIAGRDDKILAIHDIFIVIFNRDTDLQNIVLVFREITELVVVPDSHVRLRDKIHVLILTMKYALGKITYRLAIYQRRGIIVTRTETVMLYDLIIHSNSISDSNSEGRGILRRRDLLEVRDETL